LYTKNIESDLHLLKSSKNITAVWFFNHSVAYSRSNGGCSEDAIFAENRESDMDFLVEFAKRLHAWLHVNQFQCMLWPRTRLTTIQYIIYFRYCGWRCFHTDSYSRPEWGNV